MSDRTPSSRRVLAAVVLVVLGIGLGAVALEVMVRTLVPVSDFFWEWDSTVGLKLIPNKRGRSVKRGLFDVPVDINSHGFRDREHSYTTPNATPRIVLLGDSFLEALQVPFERSITARMEDRLRQAGVEAELISLGVSGFGTAREYLMLREYGLRYHPDMAVLFFVANDVSDNSQRLRALPYVPYPVSNGNGSLAHDEAGRPRFTPFADQSSTLGPLADFLRAHSKAYRLLRESIDNTPSVNELLYRTRLMSTPPERANRGLGPYEIYRPRYTPVWAEAWNLTEDMFVAIRNLARGHGIAFSVVIVPDGREVYPQWWQDFTAKVQATEAAALDPDRPSHRLASFLAGQGIPAINLGPEFRQRSQRLPTLYFKGDGHWTAEGHELAAELVAGQLMNAVRDLSRKVAPEK